MASILLFQVSWVPKDKVNFDNTLKPLIDLDGDIHWQSGVITVGILSITIISLVYDLSVCQECS